MLPCGTSRFTSSRVLTPFAKENVSPSVLISDVMANLKLLQSDEKKAEIKIFHHKSCHIVKLDYFVHCIPILLVEPVKL
jgi:hypothetical protein